MPFAIDKRLTYAALTTLVASQQPGWIPVIICASGQDRTGTNAIIFSDMWARNVYRDLGIKLTQKAMSEIHGLGTHATTIAAHTVPGSNGMKYDSQPHRIFSDKMVKHYYPRYIANTNKPKKTVAKDAITPEMVAINKCYKMLAQHQSADTIFQKIINWINSLLAPKKSITKTQDKIVPVTHEQTLFKQSPAEKIAQHCLTKVGESKNLSAFVKQLEAIQSANATLAKTLQNTPLAKAGTVAASASILDKLSQLAQGVKHNYFTAQVSIKQRVANK